MICSSCRRAASRAARVAVSSIPSPRLTGSSLRHAAPISTASSTTPRQPSNASSSTASAPSQSFSSTTASSSTSSPSSTNSPASTSSTSEKRSAPLVRSSVPAGTPLKGLNFLKDRKDPVALADDEYPDWLWTVLERQENKGEAGGAGDLFSKSKKQRRLAAKRLRKEQLLHPESLLPKEALYEQTIDLPAGDGTAAGAAQATEAREQLTKAMRNKRRADIKERNFLKTMG